jgi:hypothetical protein
MSYFRAKKRVSSRHYCEHQRTPETRHLHVLFEKNRHVPGGHFQLSHEVSLIYFKTLAVTFRGGNLHKAYINY